MVWYIVEIKVKPARLRRQTQEPRNTRCLRRQKLAAERGLLTGSEVMSWLFAIGFDVLLSFVPPTRTSQ